MASSLRTLLSERSHPILLAVFVFSLLILLTLLFSDSSKHLLSANDLLLSSSPLPLPPPPISLFNAAPNPTGDAVQSGGEPFHEVVADGDVGATESRREPPQEVADENADDGGDQVLEVRWEVCKSGKTFQAADYIPCLDNWKAIKELDSRRHMEHRERHCPKPSPRCIVPLPRGYKVPVPWPESRDMIWYYNVPHTKLVEYKKDQNWVRKSGDYLVFPGGGTQFKEGVSRYIEFIEQNLPAVNWGRHTRVVLDVGCGVASFGGYLLDKDVITMSFAPKDEHEAQIQFALERGIPAFLSVIGTQKLAFPNNVFDLIHCARCRVHWDADGGKPLLELNRILRPGGFFVWSATPVYRDNERDKSVWDAMVTLTNSICWKMVVKYTDASGIGVVIYQKPITNSCYATRKENNPPLCTEKNGSGISWYAPLDSCLRQIPVVSSGQQDNWPTSWPDRLKSKPLSLSEENYHKYAEENVINNTKYWENLVNEVYLQDLAINWSKIRNVMDMNAGFGGFAAALVKLPLWVMNIVPINTPDTLRIIFDRGLIGIYHDWCESLNTYPRTYDLLHPTFLFENLTERCDIVDVVVEMDRILRPGGYVLIQDTAAMIKRLRPVLHSLHWVTTLHKQQILVGKKGFWRPGSEVST
ncbi:putative methyltransferase PMT23 [Canna indica]|uniref:Methyltransferase n=1 Tax=Canna indica TaxID=4628 RepID=A0AAQ3QCY9_9LILI|nr:putative methyltransferase PMT23 [Canna indica]